MAMRPRKIDPGIEIGHVHLNVADLERSLAFYEGVLGFAITHRIGQSAFLSAGGYHHHIGLNTSEGRGGVPLPPGTIGSYRFAVRYPTRPALADALYRLTAAGVPLEGARTTGVSEAIYLRDPDGHGLELYYDRPREQWPRADDGSWSAVTAPLDLESLASAIGDDDRAAPTPLDETEQAAPLSDATRARFRDMRIRLLNLHKVLLEDARVAYEMDRGRIGSSAGLLQLVISDPWFAWLHPLSELVVRIDETLRPDAPATEADGAGLLEHVARLLSPEQAPAEFARRYYEALQRQPAVIVAHAEVRRILKQAK